jgi:anti-sigma regulatory factor (Ser/Thr protein kinase)/predicted transcriptional regulator
MVHELKVSDVMCKNLITVGPDALMSDLREILRENRISGLPVVKDDKLVGIISIEDFIKSLAARENGCPIGQKMTTDVKTLYEDEPLVVAIGQFEQSGMGRFPVVEREGGKLVGILTKGDVIEGLLKKLEVDYHEEEIHRYRASHIFEDIEADGTTLVFQYRVKGKIFKQAGAGSSRLRRTLLRLGLHPEIVRRVAIASYEGEMNLVFYTEGGMIRVSVQPSLVLLEVIDSGPGIEDLGKALQPGYSNAPEWVRELGFGAGMGLVNMQSMSDQFSIESEVGKGTRVSMSFHTFEAKNETE